MLLLEVIAAVVPPPFEPLAIEPAVRGFHAFAFPVSALGSIEPLVLVSPSFVVHASDDAALDLAALGAHALKLVALEAGASGNLALEGHVLPQKSPELEPIRNWM